MNNMHSKKKIRQKLQFIYKIKNDFSKSFIANRELNKDRKWKRKWKKRVKKDVGVNI